MTGRTGKLLRFRGTSGGSKLGDAELLAASARGDASAIEELFRRHGSRVYKLLYRLRGVDAKDLEDLVQATFLEVQRSAGRFDNRSSVGTWIFSIALNVRRHHVRSETRRNTFLSTAAPLMPSSGPRGPDEHVAQKEFVERLEMGLAALPEPLRTVVVLCDVEGLRGKEVARILDVPEGTVWRRLHQARQRLRAIVEGAGER
jgi:RNA polymerase sigma-70 factor (ECF subfamily)